MFLLVPLKTPKSNIYLAISIFSDVYKEQPVAVKIQRSCDPLDFNDLEAKQQEKHVSCGFLFCGNLW
jgi:hypothetical protein